MSEWHEREERLRRAVEKVSAAALGKYFKTRRAGDRPNTRVPHNVFFFGEYGEAPRAFLRGYWLYIEAPGASLPPGVELLPEGLHGRFNARLLLTSPDIDAVLSATLSAVKAAAADIGRS